MGRFYQTAKPEFVNDFIYQPPWDLIRESLKTEQNAYDVSLAKADLFKNIDINYIDDPIERERVKAKQDYYSQKSDEITNALQSSTDDWRKTMPQITNLKRELEADYKTGDIYKIQKSADMYKAMDEHLKTIKDPARKEAARKYFMSEWQQNPNRSGDAIFSSEAIFDKQDPTGEFITEFIKNATPDIRARATAGTNGRYINTSNLTTEELKNLDVAYGQFLDAKGYDPYMQQEQKLGFGTYYDENGKRLDFSDPKSSAYKQQQYIKNFEYSNTTKADKDIKADPYGLAATQYEYDKSLWTFKNSTPESAISFSKDASFYYNNTIEGKKVVQEYNTRLGELATQMGAKDPKDYQKYIDVVRSNPTKYPQQSQMIQYLDREMNNKMRSGSEYFRERGFDQKKIDLIENKFKQKGVDKILSNKDGYIDFGIIEGKQVQSKGVSEGKKINIKSLVGKSLGDMPGYIGDKIVEASIVEGTAGFIPSTEQNGTSGVSTTVKIITESGREIYPEFYIGGDPLNIGF